MLHEDLEKTETAEQNALEQFVECLRANKEGSKFPSTLKIMTSTEVRLDRPGHCFAHGGYADIYKGKILSGEGIHKAVAVKVFRGAHIDQTPGSIGVYLNRLLREYDVWGRFEHPNVLRLEGILVSSQVPSPSIVSEYKEHGDLVNFERLNSSFDRLAMARGIACGLQYLHGENVVHGDLTPHILTGHVEQLNILVDSDKKTGEFIPLITDFGKSRIHDQTGYTTNMGSNNHLSRPPELIAHDDKESPATNKSVLSFASDVYSFSLVLLRLITKKEPYTQEKLPSLQILVKIIDEGNPLRPTSKNYTLLDERHEFCWPIMQACWKHHPKDRISSKEAYERLCEILESSPQPQN